jgi:hypothetical protein
MTECSKILYLKNNAKNYTKPLQKSKLVRDEKPARKILAVTFFDKSA